MLLKSALAIKVSQHKRELILTAPNNYCLYGIINALAEPFLYSTNLRLFDVAVAITVVFAKVP